MCRQRANSRIREESLSDTANGGKYCTRCSIPAFRDAAINLDNCIDRFFLTIRLDGLSAVELKSLIRLKRSLQCGRQRTNASVDNFYSANSRQNLFHVAHVNAD